MATKPLTNEAIALTEKKMGMALDDIIKMSKNTATKSKKQQQQRRAPNKSNKFLNNAAHENALKVRRYMDSRSSLRQGVLAQRRSNFQANQFPLANEVARKAAVAPIRNGAFNYSRVANLNKARVGALPVQRRAANGGFVAKTQQMRRQRQQQHKQQEQPGNAVPKQQRPQTLDSLFANMKEQRMKVLSRQNNAVQRNGGGQQRVPWARGRYGN